MKKLVDCCDFCFGHHGKLLPKRKEELYHSVCWKQMNDLHIECRPSRAVQTSGTQANHNATQDDGRGGAT